MFLMMFIITTVKLVYQKYGVEYFNSQVIKQFQIIRHHESSKRNARILSRLVSLLSSFLFSEKIVIFCCGLRKKTKIDCDKLCIVVGSKFY